ncbi:MAG: ATP synthase F1 subunit delta [Phycisphaeraceae bacterium]
MAESTELFSLVERVYAGALLDLAQKAGQVDPIAGQVSQLLEVVQQNAALLELMRSRSLGVKRRRLVLDRIFKDKVHELLWRFLHVLNNRNRFEELPRIGKAFLRLVDERHGVVQAQAYVAQPLDQATLDRITRGIAGKLNRKVVVTQHTEPSMIGGLRLRLGDEVIDGSVATQLRRIEQQLVAAASQSARNGFDRFVTEEA